MVEKHSSKVRLSLVGLMIVFVIAFGLDQGIYALRRYAENSLDFQPLFVLMTFGNIVLAGSLLALAWYIYLKAERNRIIAALFLISGGLTALYPAAFILLNSGGNMPDLFRSMFLYLTPDTRLHFAAAFVTMIGMMDLIRRRR